MLELDATMLVTHLLCMWAGGGVKATVPLLGHGQLKSEQIPKVRSSSDSRRNSPKRKWFGICPRFLRRPGRAINFQFQRRGHRLGRK